MKTAQTAPHHTLYTYIYIYIYILIYLFILYYIYIIRTKYQYINNLEWVWFSFLKLGFLKKWSFQKVHNEKVFFQKAECLAKAIKKCFLKKLSVWLALIKVVVLMINYQKEQCIYKWVYFILKSILWNYFFLTNIS